ncbi:prepilin peptidase [Halogeometricum borinquense]|uniref:Prepilin peptidase n=1 Tax=Halogeometricum borinquense TaxID=60847 RepID=A0A6C0ULG6_9EURY|nr:A24 family peptidase [Halogeometricum borinquense]QIB76282.1 prepilin peptidase [Halogeometricum borinquense]QIQ75284.1 prepilin peptidase [Halogeometricum borinquense]
MNATLPDILRLVIVPVLGWAAWRDIETRRVPSVIWYPLVALGVVLLAWDTLPHLAFAPEDILYFVRVGISLLFVAPLSYIFWRLGGFGGADAKALITISILVPTFPQYLLPGLSLPTVRTTLGVFSMTILTNTVVLAVGYPLALAVRNLADGNAELPLMFLGRRIPVGSLATAHGRLFETTTGYTRNGLDIDALRMYLRWRGTTLSELREHPDKLRDPTSITETHDPTDGAVGDGMAVDGGTVETEDPWGAAAFLDDIDSTAYGTTPEKLRDGLQVVASQDEVWISPGIPFIVPMFVGTVIAFTYGDIVFGIVGALGLV